MLLEDFTLTESRKMGWDPKSNVRSREGIV